MKVINYWKFDLDSYSSYMSLAGNFSSIESCIEHLQKSEAFKSYFASNGIKYQSNNIDELLKNGLIIEVSNKNEDYVEMHAYVEGDIVYKVVDEKIPEIKEAGKPYQPEQIIYKEITESGKEVPLVFTIYKKQFKLDGIPTFYRELEDDSK